jgi:hypothetical protein
MAMSRDGQSTGAQDRIGTIAFMATSTLGPEPYTHRPIHDCESIFWLCALGLLPRVDVETIKGTLANIYCGKDFVTVADAKASVIMRLKQFKGEGSWPKGLDSLGKSNDSPLFFCLTALMREFDDNNFANGYLDAKDGFEDHCFDRCIEII